MPVVESNSRAGAPRAKGLTHRARFVWGSAVLGVVFAVTLVFWAFEFRQTVDARAADEEETLARHQKSLLALKAAEVRDLFDELYQNARTISLLPAVREITGRNRTRVTEDPVELGRLSPETHRTIQQLYTNLHTYIRVSEIYYVLDGFAPERGEVPLFMYDDLIAGRGDVGPGDRQATSEAEAHARPSAATGATGATGATPALEIEDFEYAWFVKQLAWFRNHAPSFHYERSLHLIPALVSPLMRTCDNTQFPTENSNPRDVQGFIHAMPVYDLRHGRFNGMITTVVRANQLEAKLIGVPFLPLSESEKRRAAAEGWQMPEAPSSFVLTEQDSGLEISDRRNPRLSAGLDAVQGKGDGRWARLPLALQTDGRWTLHHGLSGVELDRLLSESRRAGREAIGGRFLLLGVLLGLFGSGYWRELVRMLNYDGLTGLPNRRLFFARLKGTLARARRHGTRVALFHVDVADLNAVNDTFGHHAGDQLLVELASRLRRDPLPVVYRLGGDEFTILCENVTAEDALVSTAERILAAVGDAFVVDGNPMEIRLNIGVTVFPDDADESDGGERLLMCADSAMNECKQNRTGGYVLFNEKTRARIEREHALAVELQMALSRGQFELFYQPKASLRDDTVLSMEALLRWQHPVFGSVSPVECIPILERSGGIIEVGEWVVEQACRDLKRFADAGHPDIRIGVNVSMRQLRRGDFHETLSRIFERFGVEPRQIIVEITESMAMEDLERGRQHLETLKALGVGLSIDDFGAGYSSLTYLQRLPIDSLKLDRGLIEGMVDARSLHVVESVIRLAQGLSLTTIAEGVETQTQRDHLAGMGCDKIQGFLLSRALPFEEIIEWLASRKETTVDLRETG